MDKTNVKGAVEAAPGAFLAPDFTARTPKIDGVLSFAAPVQAWLLSDLQREALDASARKLATAIATLAKRILSVAEASDAVVRINDAALSVSSGLNQTTPALLARVESLHRLEIPDATGLAKQAAAGTVPGGLSGEPYQELATKTHYRPEQIQKQVSGILPPLETLSTVGGMLENQFTGRVAENLTGPLLRITDTIMANLPELQEFLAAVADKIGEIGGRFAQWLPTVINATIAVKNAVGGWKPLLDGLERIAWLVALIKGVGAVLTTVNSVKDSLKQMREMYDWFHKSKPALPGPGKSRSGRMGRAKNFGRKISNSLRTLVPGLKKRLLPVLARGKDMAVWTGKQGRRLLKKSGGALMRGAKALPGMTARFTPKIQKALPVMAARFMPMLQKALPLVSRVVGLPMMLLIPTNNTPTTSEELRERDQLLRRDWENSRARWRKEHPNQPLPDYLAGEFTLLLGWMNQLADARPTPNIKTHLEPGVTAASNALLTPFAPQAVENMRNGDWLAAQRPELTLSAGRPPFRDEPGAPVNNTSVQNNIEQSNQFNIYAAPEPRQTADAISEEMLGVYSQLNEIFTPGGY